MQVEKWVLVLRKGRSEEVLGKLVSCGAGAVGGLLGALRMGAALAGNVGTGGAFALCARGVRVLTFQCSLRPDPLPLGRFLEPVPYAASLMPP